jgi:fructose-specific phosphotransferase system IIB component
MKKIVAVTACPTGIAHTYMAAETLEISAKKENLLIKVETQGAMGVENELTKIDIELADVVILAIDVAVDESRFLGKKIYKTSTTQAIRNAKKVLLDALDK